MCGIAGIINFKNQSVSPAVLKQMTDAIAHRGPDGEGHWVEHNVGLGHRRLAIQDLSSAGHQPMMTRDGRFVLSYNGEIYNFKELRIELERKGYVFYSNTDSEVLLNSWSAWGVKSLDRFNGMFAFAIWDRKDKKLTLARDRYGIKPLYISENSEGLAFGSEQKAILAQPGRTVAVDREALLEYFTFQNLFTNRTLTKGITLFPAGYYATLDIRETSPKLKYKKYWDFNFSSPTGKIDRREYVEELDRLFAQAVNRQLITDVELGAYLSGGMDSGSITSIAAQSIQSIKTFTCGFDLSSASGIELAFDERIAAEAMSAKFKTEHYEMVLKAGDMERCLPRLSHHLEEPRVGQSYPNFYAAQLASKFVKVVLSGAGGDELFGGYPWRYYRAVACKNFDDYVDQYYGFWQRLANNNDLRRMFAPIKNDIENVWTRDIFCEVFKGHAEVPETAEDYVNQSLYFEAKTFLHGLFVVEDKLSMAHGLETRVPFMDNDLVEFAMRCPVSLKLNNLSEVISINENEPGDKPNKYFRKTNDGKQILREMMTKYIPETITKAAKQGFSSPDASWFKGESIEFVRNKLLNKHAPLYEFLDFNTTRELLNQHLEGKQNRRLLIWSLLNVNQWLENSI
jgi:asparagine synthase (glutamine-hydrolysing)